MAKNVQESNASKKVKTPLKRSKLTKVNVIIAILCINIVLIITSMLINI